MTYKTKQGKKGKDKRNEGWAKEVNEGQKETNGGGGKTKRKKRSNKNVIPISWVAKVIH